MSWGEGRGAPGNAVPAWCSSCLLPTAVLCAHGATFALQWWKAGLGRVYWEKQGLKHWASHQLAIAKIPQ